MGHFAVLTTRSSIRPSRGPTPAALAARDPRRLLISPVPDPATERSHIAKKLRARWTWTRRRADLDRYFAATHSGGDTDASRGRGRGDGPGRGGGRPGGRRGLGPGGPGVPDPRPVGGAGSGGE